MSKYSEYLNNQKQNTINFYANILEGLGFAEASNKYCEVTRRVNDDETKILVNVNKKQLFSTQYGYGLIVGKNSVVWLKNWQVFVVADYFKTSMTNNCLQVLLNKEYYNVKESTREFDVVVGDCASDSEFEKANGYHSWKDMVERAKAQEKVMSENPVKFVAI